jgi:hypothetical protein
MRTNLLDELRERIAVVGCHPPMESGRIIHPVWGGALGVSVMHEWFGASLPSRPHWAPPLCILTDLASLSLEGASGRLAVWIGGRCRPSVFMLARRPVLLRASVFLNPPDDAARLWLIDLAARSSGVAAVIADGSGLSMPATRRVQIAASHGGALCLLARPEWERAALSAACTRWSVRPEASQESRPRWSVALLRDKADRGLRERAPAWLVEWNDEEGCLGVVAGVGRAACRSDLDAASA